MCLKQTNGHPILVEKYAAMYWTRKKVPPPKMADVLHIHSLVILANDLVQGITVSDIYTEFGEYQSNMRPPECGYIQIIDSVYL